MNDDLRVTERLTVVTGIDSSDKVQVVSRLNCMTDLRAHSPSGPENTNPDRHAATISATPLSATKRVIRGAKLTIFVAVNMGIS